jgi:hypothetical protein
MPASTAGKRSRSSRRMESRMSFFSPSCIWTGGAWRKRRRQSGREVDGRAAKTRSASLAVRPAGAASAARWWRRGQRAAPSGERHGEGGGRLRRSQRAEPIRSRRGLGGICSRLWLPILEGLKCKTTMTYHGHISKERTRCCRHHETRLVWE